MSSILNALKKLDDERQRETRRKTVPLDSAILHEDHRITAEKKALLPIVAATLIIVFGFISVIYFSISRSGNSGSPVTVARNTVKAEKSTMHHAVESVLPAKTQAVFAEPAKAERMQIPPRIKETTAAAQPLRKPAHVVAVAPGREPSNTAKLPPLTLPVIRPALKLNGIAYRSGDAASSVAIINGKSVEVGETVDGARVEEIHKERVKLNFSGEKIELVMSR